MPYPTPFSVPRRNPAGIALVVGLHVLFILALASGFKIHPSFTPPQNILARVIDQQPVKLPELQPPADPTHPLAFVDPTDPKLPQIPVYPDPPPIDPSSVLPTQPAGPGAGLVVPSAPVFAEPSIDPRRPLTQPPYPPAAIRTGTEGKLSLDVLVATDGRVRDARVVQGSGSALLDQAAIDEARRHWKLRPATRDGVPFEKWYTLKVVFHLENR